MTAGCAIRRPVLCVIPFAESDYDLALELVVWIKELGGCPRNHLLFVAANNVTEPHKQQIIEVAKQTFRSVRYITPPQALKNEKWPLGANWLFQTASQYIEANIKCPWWWNEPDCIPLRPGWLEFLEHGYYSAGKPYMGCVTPETTVGNKIFPAFLTGCAMYPADTATRLNGLNWWCGEAWDILAGPIVVKDSHHTCLYQYFWGEQNLAPTFREYHEKGEPRNVFTLEQLRKEAVVFHRNKDRTLIPLLRRNRKACIGKIIHVVERHVTNESRVARAVKSWETLYNTGKVTPVHVWKYPRSALDIGDKRDLPYLKDVLKAGMNEADDEDIIMLTNGDNILHQDLPQFLSNRFQTRNCQCSFRLNFTKPPDLSLSPSTLAKQGKPDFGRDLFAFRKSWLLKHWDNIPHMFLGELEWDLILALMIRKDNGVPTIKTQDLHNGHPNSELPLGYVIHEMHDRKWLSNDFINSQAKRYNAMLAKRWYSANNLNQFYTLW